MRSGNSFSSSENLHIGRFLFKTVFLRVRSDLLEGCLLDSLMHNTSLFPLLLSSISLVVNSDKYSTWRSNKAISLKKDNSGNRIKEEYAKLRNHTDQTQQKGRARLHWTSLSLMTGLGIEFKLSKNVWPFGPSQSYQRPDCVSKVEETSKFLYYSFHPGPCFVDRLTRLPLFSKLERLPVPQPEALFFSLGIRST